MAKMITSSSPSSCPNLVVEEDYIDMDLSPNTSSPPPHCSREFEFQHVMAATTQEKEATITSPADELFYKGNLLPLHLPLRLQLVQNLLQEPSKEAEALAEKLDAKEAPLDSLPECDNAASNTKKSWSKKLKIMRQAPLTAKLKASRDYFKSFFTKSRDTSDVYVGGTLKSSIERAKTMEDELCHRKSFSGIIRRRFTSKSSSASPLCSSSSSSSSSTPSGGNMNGFFNATPTLKRSSSASSEKEGAIQGAIAYCKKSSQQQMLNARRSVSDVVLYSLSGPTKVAAAAAAAASDGQERQEISRG